MKRDIDLVRGILLEMESDEHGFFARLPAIAGRGEAEIGYHVHLMSQAGLITAADATSLGCAGPNAIPLSITWAGHEFIDAARNDAIWNKTKSKAISSGLSFTFELLKELLVAAAKGPLGLS